MERQIGHTIRRRAWVLALSALWGAPVISMFAQESVQPVSAPAPTEAAAPAAPATAFSLDDCLRLGEQNQPALAAAHSSLAAAHTASGSLNRMILPRLITPDLKIRKQQACLGISAAEGRLVQTEWDNRYAITRNFFTIQYVRMQADVIDDVLASMTRSRKRAKQLYDSGNADVKITKIDLEQLDVQFALVKTKKSQIDNGMLKAFAALREAMGVGCDFEINVVNTGLPPTVYSFNKNELIASALANRGEMTAVGAVNSVVELEVCAQNRIRGWKGLTFAFGSDLHAVPIPLGTSNGEYRPSAEGFEMPVGVVGRKADRVQRVQDLLGRANAVVAKTHNLVALDVEIMYLKWKEAVEDIGELQGIVKIAQDLPVRVQDLLPKDYTSSAIIQSNTTSIMTRTQLNEAIYMHALALAGLERATAGGFSIYPVPAPKAAAPK
jgi:hypothetical protein